jgi:hypothetical protein
MPENRFTEAAWAADEAARAAAEADAEADEQEVQDGGQQ